MSRLVSVFIDDVTEDRLRFALSQNSQLSEETILESLLSEGLLVATRDCGFDEQKNGRTQ